MTRRQRVSSRLALLACALAFAGCAGPSPLYGWGRYEATLWAGYRAEGDPGSHAAMLEEDIARMRAEGKRVAPGVHAQIGFLRYATGDLERAREHFVEERQLFPESAVFIDGVLARMDGPAPRALPGPVPHGEKPGEPESDQEARP